MKLIIQKTGDEFNYEKGLQELSLVISWQPRFQQLMNMDFDALIKKANTKGWRSPITFKLTVETGGFNTITATYKIESHGDVLQKKASYSAEFLKGE